MYKFKIYHKKWDSGYIENVYGSYWKWVCCSELCNGLGGIFTCQYIMYVRGFSDIVVVKSLRGSSIGICECHRSYIKVGYLYNHRVSESLVMPFSIGLSEVI